MSYHCPQQKLCKWYVLDSLDKDGERRFDALDRVLWEGSLIWFWYGIGQNTVKIKPNSLTFFELIFLAKTVHEFAPQYMTLEKNCLPVKYFMIITQKMMTNPTGITLKYWDIGRVWRLTRYLVNLIFFFFCFFECFFFTIRFTTTRWDWTEWRTTGIDEQGGTKMRRTGTRGLRCFSSPWYVFFLLFIKNLLIFI
jgi:hypothetical protein